MNCILVGIHRIVVVLHSPSLLCCLIYQTLQEQDFGEVDVETGRAALSIQLSTGETNDGSSSCSNKEENKMSTTTTTTTKVVSNACAICLDTYQVGQGIAWSCNEQCQHCFHQICITDYLVYRDLKKDSGGENNSKAPCPCCRQDFLLRSTRRETAL